VTYTARPGTVAQYAAGRTVEDGDCLRWTGTVCNGHPAGAWGGKRCRLIRREVWEAANGPIPAGKIIRCTCETPLCVALDHLSVATYRSVARQCAAQGLMSGPVRSGRIAAAKRAGPQARITQEDARAIRESDESGRVWADRLGISPSTVSKIRRGQVRREFVGNAWSGLAEFAQRMRGAS
jgi:HNH endonuclease